LDIAPDPTPQQPVDVKSKERKIAEVGDITEKGAEEQSVPKAEEQPKRVSRFKKDRVVPSPSPAAPPHHVVEKRTEQEALDGPEEPPMRVSRFKKDRTVSLSPTTAPLPPGPHQVPASFFPARAAPAAEPTPPEHSTVASEVVERPVVADPIEPDEMDDVLLYKEAAVEYNRLRNQLIQKQGGIAQQDGALDSETGLVPLDEELGGPKRLSKFKAGRLTKLQ
jgi:unconventional prefoldin RPB5 interactor 1